MRGARPAPSKATPIRQQTNLPVLPGTSGRFLLHSCADAENPGHENDICRIKNAKDIADLWAYLKQFGPDGEKK
jgi:hypothetical protein